jgi:hypothetical protein
LPATWYFQINGLDLSNVGSGITAGSIAGVAFDPVWFPKLTPTTVAEPMLALLFIVALAVIYPGLKAALIKPVDAIHHQ